LTLPGLQADCEKLCLNGLLKTWGKVLPLGAPVLMWSATGRDEVRKDLVIDREVSYKIDVTRSSLTESRSAISLDTFINQGRLPN
jgi:hypothetical protein